jgi:hypothetical protein
MNRTAIILVALFVLLGPTPLVIGTVLTWMVWREHRQEVQAEEERKTAGWIEAEAKVVSCNSATRNSRSGDWTYRCETEWTDRDGRTHRSSTLGSNSSGRSFPILYNPDNPEQYTGTVGWFFPHPLILSVIGFAFTFLGVKSWRKARAEPLRAAGSPETKS